MMTVQLHNRLTLQINFAEDNLQREILKQGIALKGSSYTELLKTLIKEAQEQWDFTYGRLEGKEELYMQVLER